MRSAFALLIAGGLVAGGACSTGGDGGKSTTGDVGGELGTGGEVGGGPPDDPCADVTCEDGQICMGGECFDGCLVNTDCESGLSCCNGGCVDVATDLNHCGNCNEPCVIPANVAVSCQAGLCNVGACDDGYFDCDGAPGCEADMMCSCMPGEMQSCYPGPVGTDGQGVCVAGTRKCNAAGTAWSLCNGFVIPSPELCANNIDEDCSGTPDDLPDLDGDGWTACDNDCCETTQDCADPAKVNPGAFEFVGNMLDDDCDSATSDTTPAAACSAVADFSNVMAQQVADAMELCQTTTANAPLPQKKWGVVSADWYLANGNAAAGAALNNIRSWQAAIVENYGTGGVVPLNGNTMAGISSGRMRDANDSGFVIPVDGSNFASVSSPPAAYLAAHGGNLPSSLGCSGTCPAGGGANDSVNARFEIRVPTNALSFSYKFRFFTAEYWTFSCDVYNDFFLALLTSGAAMLPADKNISFDGLGNPISVNNGFFDTCQPKGCYSCPQGFAALLGTGMDADDPYAPGFQRTGGGTVWLQTTAPIVPGETMIFELMVFDVSDNWLDSVVLLDDFEWSIDPSGVGTGPPG